VNKRVEEVRAIIEADTLAALYVLRVIWNRQKPEEKFTGQHMGHDSKGFREFETVTLNALHDDLERQSWRPAARQATMLRDMVPPYAKQYIADSEERGVDPLARLPRSTRRRSQAKQAKQAKVNKKPVIRKGDTSEKERAQILANVEAMAKRHNI